MNYTPGYFDGIEIQGLASAAVVVPIVLDLLHPESVVDVGCGRGAWLQAFRERGVTRALGIDGPFVDRSRLLVPPECFRMVDLSEPFVIGATYDLAVCLEVAEHLEPRSGRRLVEQLTACAPFVLFSAALPDQGGDHHVNEQWPEYWQRLFQERGFVLLDPIRRCIREDRRVAWWYRQNVVIYASQAAVAASPVLQEEEKRAAGMPIEWIHVEVLSGRGVGSLLREGPALFARALRRRLDRLRGKMSGPDDSKAPETRP